MENSDFFLITAFDGKAWQPDELVEQSPIPRVRQLLGGRWERSSKPHPFMRAFFGKQKRVLAMGFPPGTTREKAEAALKQILEERGSN